MVILDELIARGEILFHPKERQGSLRVTLVRGAAGTFALKLISAGLSFLISVFLARLLGPAGYGAYVYAISWVALLSVLALLGLDNLLIREIAVYRVRSEWALMHGLLRWANLLTLLISVGLALLAAVCTWILVDHFESHMVSAVWVALIMIPFVALTRLRQAALQGLQHVVLGQLPETLIRRFLFIVIAGFAYLALGDHLTATWAVSIDVLAAGAALLIGVRLLRKTLSQHAQEAVPAYQIAAWARSMLPFLSISVMQAVSGQVALVLLGTIKGAEAVGIYAVANRAAALITFALLAINAALSPSIASLYATQDIKHLQRVVTKSARTILFISFPIAISLVFFAHRFLLFFGQEFTAGEVTLLILIAGQLFGAAMGSVGVLLNMTGHERDTALVLEIISLSNVILSAILIPRWGIEGAATATTISVIIWNLSLGVLVYKRIGIHATAFGTIGLRRTT